MKISLRSYESSLVCVVRSLFSLLTAVFPSEKFSFDVHVRVVSKIHPSCYIESGFSDTKRRSLRRSSSPKPLPNRIYIDSDDSLPF